MAAWRRFSVQLGIVAVAAGAWRIWYILGPVRDRVRWPALSDEWFYHRQAELVADGHGFIEPFRLYIQHRSAPTAFHPPLYSAFLALPAKLGFTTQIENRIATALLGTLTVVLIGLLGRAIAGDRVGIVAAVIAAAYPPLWSNDSVIGLETPFCFLVVLGLLVLYRRWRTPNLWWAAAVAACFAFAALTRTEGVILLVLIAVMTVIWAPGWDRATRFRALGVMAIVSAVVLAPWMIRNVTTFEEPTLLSSSFGIILAYGNCDATYHGSHLGYWDDACSLKNYSPRLEESVVDKLAREKGLDYIEAHASRVPVVLAARVGRLWELFRPTQNVTFNEEIEQRGSVTSWAILVSFYLLMPFAMGGLVVMRRRRIPIFPMLTVAASVTITSMLAYPITRYRASFDAVVPVLAAVAVTALWERRRGAATESTTTPVTEPAPTDSEQVEVAR
jgi:Dolichyl-phosphate-mannose-protein mannosyltransferase